MIDQSHLKEAEAVDTSQTERYATQNVARIAAHYGDILEALGENPKRQGLLKTPERVAKALQFLTHGYDLDPQAVLRSAMFEEDYSQMVVVKDIEVFSMCEHHMLPFFGKAHTRSHCKCRRRYKRAPHPGAARCF